MTEQIKVNGRYLMTIGQSGGLKYSTVADGGSEQASWRMQLPDRFAHPSLRMGALVEIKSGPTGLWNGVMSQPKLGDDGWEFEAIGLSDELYTAYLCFDSGMNTTSIPNTAVDQAIARGFPGTRPASLSAAAFGDGINSAETDSLNFVGDLLDAWSTSDSKRWMVNGAKQVIAYPTPTTPTWYMRPKAARIGLADDDYASNLFLRFRSTAGKYDTVQVSDTLAAAARRREHPVDATNLGVTTSAKVTTVGNGLLAKGKARYGWTESIDLTKWQLTTPGGQPAPLKLVKGGDLVRALGVRNEQGKPLPYYDWVIGRTEYEPGSKSIQLAPTQLAARNLGDLLSLAVTE